MSTPPPPQPPSGKRLSLSPEAKALRERSAQAAASNQGRARGKASGNGSNGGGGRGGGSSGKKGFTGPKPTGKNAQGDARRGPSTARPATTQSPGKAPSQAPARAPGKPNRPAAKSAASPARADARPNPRSTARPTTRPNTYRAEPEGRTQRPARPQPRSDVSGASEAEGIRLNKRMADLGLCSRREADDWIAKGWVQVNNAVAAVGQRVQVQDRIQIAPAARAQKGQQATFLLHKPIGYVSGQAEDGHEPASVLLTAANRWKADPSAQRFHPSQLRGLAPAGRLDIDSTGLLVLTQDGLIARSIIGEDSQVEKEYLVRVEYQCPTRGVVTREVQAAFPPAQLALLRHGLSLDGKALRPATVEWQNPEQLRFVLQEGKKRQIRRMCEQVGLKVVGLKRIRIGNVMLGNLPKGQWRYLAPGELDTGA